MVSVKKAIEMLWKDICTIYINQEITNPVTKRTEFEEIPLHEDEPCKLSYSTITTTDDSNTVAGRTIKAKIFIAPELDIPPGSKIKVTSKGRTLEFQQSGVSAVYSHHQEVLLELFKGWA